MHHENSSFNFDPEFTRDTVRWKPYDRVPAIIARSDAIYRHSPVWYRDFLYVEERERGLDCVEDLASPGVFEWVLQNQPAILTFSAEGFASIEEKRTDSVQELRENELARRQKFSSSLDAAAESYLVRRGPGKTIIAGYPWFGDWGRNALWIGQSFSTDWQPLFKQASEAFASRYWNDTKGQLYDVIDVDHQPGTVDASVRPNQIFAVGGLPLILLPMERARQVVEAVETALYTPIGLRSLAPGEPGYASRYEGDVRHRDTAYHQGTVWPWLIGPFIEAWVRVRGGTPEAKSAARQQFLEPLRNHLKEAGLGHVSEIADAEPPHRPRGCPFQAWSLGELLRVERIVLA